MLKDAGIVDFNEVHSSAFPYFANALTVHTEMIYYKSSITAVQALAAMAIDDDSITCPLPEVLGSGNENRVEYFNHLIHLTQILSAVLKFVMRLETRGIAPDKVFRRVQHLNAQLRTWAESAPPTCRPDPLRKSSLPPSVPINLILYVRYTYHGAVIALNSCFTYPWVTERVKYREDSRFQKQIDESTALVAEMSRLTIKDTKHIDIDFTSPVWLVFYYPLVGLLHLFVHIIKSPRASTVQYDLALLEDICGHFARLKYTTSSALSFPHLKELCRFAERTVESISSTDDAHQAMNGHAGTMPSGSSNLGYGIPGNPPEGDDETLANSLTDFSEALDFDFLDANLSFEPLYPTYRENTLL
ncbi:hypothetical protein SLS55_003893 [Diplodia seriata]|uniref:C6 transcription factor n=1 Tax=Diplodia seriata TaxID=420778 RepID=A0ABR3CI51_9PEZI